MERRTLHFSLGETFGILLQNIAHEHLFCSLDPEKAIDSLVGSGCPREYVLRILKNELYLTVDGDDSMSIVTEDKLPEGHLEEYHKFNPKFIFDKLNGFGGSPLIDQGYYFQKHLYDFFASHLLYYINVDATQSIMNLPEGYDWELKTKLSPLDIAHIWLDNKSDMKEILESAEITKCFSQRVSDIFNELEGLRKFVTDGYKLIHVKNWIEENNMGNIPTEFPRFEEIVYQLADLLDVLQELDDDKIHAWVESHKYLEESNKVVDNAIINKEIESPYEQLMNRVFGSGTKRDIAEPVEWDHEWTAGFIDREGHIYAMDGHESRLAHLEIADAYYEKYPETPLIENNKDWSLDTLGWVRFHDGKIRYSGYYGIGMKELPFTSRQKEKLAQYTENFYPNGIYNEGNGNNHVTIKAIDWRTMSDDEFRKIFDI